MKVTNFVNVRPAINNSAIHGDPSTAGYLAAHSGARSRQWRAQGQGHLLQPLIADMADHVPEHEQRSNPKDYEDRPQSPAHGFKSDVAGIHGPDRTYAGAAGDADALVRDSRALQQPTQSPFSNYNPVGEQIDESHEHQSEKARTSAREGWQSAGKKIAEKGPIRFHGTPALSSDDTAHTTSGVRPPELERKSSFFARSSMNLSKLSKSFTDNRAGQTAMAETVKLAQQQQQANRQSAAPVLKAVPSTKVSFS